MKYAYSATVPGLPLSVTLTGVYGNILTKSKYLQSFVFCTHISLDDKPESEGIFFGDESIRI